MDVQLPDGTIVTNVPDGITQSELLRRLGKSAPESDAIRRQKRQLLDSGVSMRGDSVNWGVELEKQINSEMSTPERVFKSLGAGLADIPLALRQIFNRDSERARQLEQEAADKREGDRDLAKKTNLNILPDQVLGMDVPTLGSTAQVYGKTAPTMAIPATRLAGLKGVATNFGVGAGLSALDPTVEGESRGMNMATGGALSAALPLTMSAISPVWNAVTRSGGQRKAADEVAKTITPDGADSNAVLRQTIDRLRQAQGGRPGAPNIPLSTAAQLRDAELARLEAGSRVRNGANWFDFDQNQARSVADEVRRATSSADEVGTRRALRSSNRATNYDQAMSSVNEQAFLRDVQGLRQNLEVAIRHPEASDPAVRSMLEALRNEMDRLGPDLRPEHLATIRANLASKAPLVPQNAYQAAPRSSPATMSVLRGVDDILNNATNGRWQNVVSGYARDSDAVRAAQAAGKVREAYWDNTGRVRKTSADPAGDVPMITAFNLGSAIDSTRGPTKNVMLSNEANTRLNAVLDALRSQDIVKGVKRSATAGGGSDTASNLYAAKAAGRVADALGASGSATAAVGKGVLDKLREVATANKDRALAEALQNPQQMINLLEAKLRAGAPMSPQEQYLLSLLRGAPAAAATAN